MKRYCLWVKSLVFFLAVVTLLGVAVSGLGIFAAESQCMYTQDDYEEWIYSQYQSSARMIAEQALWDYGADLSDCPDWLLEQTGHLDAVNKVESWYNLSENDWCYTIRRYDQVLRKTDGANVGEDPLHFIFTIDLHYPVLAKEADYIEYFLQPETDEPVSVTWQYESGYQVDIYISREHTSYYVNQGLSQNMMKWLFAARYPMVAVAAVSLLLFAVSFIFLMALAGKDPKNGEANPRALNKLPLDLYLAGAAAITLIGCWLAIEALDILFDNSGYNVLMVMLLCGSGIIVATTVIGFFSALAAQFKVPGGFWWRHSLCAKVLKLICKVLAVFFRWVGKGCRFCGRCISRLLGVLPVIWEWLLIAFGLALGLFITMIITFETGFFLVLLWWCAIGVIVVGYGGWCYGNIRKGIRRMKEGDLNQKINTEWMFGSFKAIAEDLNALADVVAIAAEKQLRSERMKTELITNVSHDIKTPLTSVINYVDLLQQPHSEEEGEQYLEVLSRQSLRLKKLVEDLMDMSKASTGNMTVSITPVDAVETVNQALGEFADKLEAAKLTPVFRSPDSQLHMLADGKLTWRVLSNLLSNVVKYALPGTRVYIDLLRLDKSVVLSVKNISREELNISAEELTERFVRGDASRNTEGSGLGLNIAQNLMTLQRGTMELTVDGDLFKVTLTFPTE